MNVAICKIGTVALCLAQVLVGQAQLKPVRAHNPNRPEALTLVVSPGGFSERSVSVPQGVYLIDVVNRTGGRPLQLRLEQEVGQSRLRLVEVNATPERKRSLQNLQRLTPGTYHLSVANVPAWTIAINVR